jgi:hypothetical protein
MSKRRSGRRDKESKREGKDRETSEKRKGEKKRKRKKESEGAFYTVREGWRWEDRSGLSRLLGCVLNAD